MLAVLFLEVIAIAGAGAGAASQVGGFREYEVAQVPGGFIMISVRAIDGRVYGHNLTRLGERSCTVVS